MKNNLLALVGGALAFGCTPRDCETFEVHPDIRGDEPAKIRVCYRHLDTENERIVVNGVEQDLAGELYVEVTLPREAFPGGQYEPGLVVASDFAGRDYSIFNYSEKPGRTFDGQADPTTVHELGLPMGQGFSVHVDADRSDEFSPKYDLFGIDIYDLSSE